MKAIITTALLVLIIGNIGAVDIESYQFIDHLRDIIRPGRPEIFEDGVLFTASSSWQRVGISFAHDNYTKVHWFRQLLLPKDQAEFTVNGKINNKIDQYEDSGILFHVEQIPSGVANMDYRLIIDGLWTTDPSNPIRVTGPSGVVESRFPLPERPKTATEPAMPGFYRFSYRAPPGETITVGGSFNNWDPFMYELRETSPGLYNLTLALPPGSFQYTFFYRGQQLPDPANPYRVYSQNGRVVSQGTVL